MDQNRRDFLKMSATIVGGASIGFQSDTNAQEIRAESDERVKSMTPLVGQSGLVL